MNLGSYIRALRAHRMFLLTSILICAAAAAAIAWSQTPTYEASTQMFVSARGISRAPGQSYEAGLYAQQRARSYAEVISGPRGAQMVIDDLGLTESVESMQERISATVPRNSVLINVAVRDQSPGQAKAIADSLADELPSLAERLEAPEGSSPVKVSVTRPAQMPAGPVSPRKPIYLAFGVLFGLSFGVAGALMRNRLDSRLRTDADAVRAARAPILGRIPPYRERPSSPVVLADPASAAAESYHTLRANLRALSTEHELRSFVVTSAVGVEGKTDVTANLGIALAQAGETVVVVDANLRSPRLGERLGLPIDVGLSRLLEEGRPLDLALRTHPATALEVLAGTQPAANPGELLESEAVAGLLEALTDRFEFVLVDTPALLPVADAAIIARQVSASLLVTRPSTRANELQAARRALDAAGGRVLGVALNGVNDVDSRRGRRLRPGRTRALPHVGSSG